MSPKRKPDPALAERLRAAAESAAKALENPTRAEADTFHAALRLELLHTRPKREERGT